MTNDEGRKPEGAPERSPKAGEGAPSGVDGNGPRRFSVQRKMAIVARLLRGEPLDLVARQTNVCNPWRPGRRTSVGQGGGMSGALQLGSHGSEINDDEARKA
jgi:hypothetical protein